jgi:Asp-tRNA(Asn)/Glu-tRNA(Gln) amidotransferase A subunit family amidase
VTNLPVGPIGAEAYAYHTQYMDRSPQLYQEETLLRLRPTAEVTAAGCIDVIHSLERLRREVKQVFAAVDSLVTPPCGFTHDGLPKGLQISGPQWEERRKSCASPHPPIYLHACTQRE